ncbi:MAG: GntR family transcriptional regulator [Kiritimatiellaeota bacterium]|nr:GntR family transcriptional regulator [Kiritimatiellota bacterium]
MDVKKEVVLRRIQETALAQIAACGKVTETELAQMTGVSRTPVREALAGLMANSILIRRQNVGIVLKSPATNEIVELYEARAAIECAAARLTAERAESAWKQRLLALAKVVDRVPASRKKTAYFDDRADCRFHKNIVDACGNRHLQRLYEHFQMLRLTLCFGHLHQLLVMRHTHVHIAEALISGRADKAERTVRLHINEAIREHSRANEKISRERG